MRRRENKAAKDAEKANDPFSIAAILSTSLRVRLATGLWSDQVRSLAELVQNLGSGVGW